jgi:hypothetical protein
MREDFLKEEFYAAGAIRPFKEFITIFEFKAKYGEAVIEGSEKVKQLLFTIENERDLGISDGRIEFDDFSYMYMFLEFKDVKKTYRKQLKAAQMILRKKSDDAYSMRSKKKRTSILESEASQAETESGEALSDDSFQTDSDFEDLDDDPAINSGRVLLDDTDISPSKGYKKKSKFAVWMTRLERRYNKSAMGKKIKAWKEVFGN